jgi:hypothetical protein
MALHFSHAKRRDGRNSSSDFRSCNRYEIHSTVSKALCPLLQHSDEIKLCSAAVTAIWSVINQTHAKCCHHTHYIIQSL